MWIIKAGQRISPVMTMKGCRKLCISRAVHRTDDDTLWSYSEEDGKMKAPTVSDGDNDTDW